MITATLRMADQPPNKESTMTCIDCGISHDYPADRCFQCQLETDLRFAIMDGNMTYSRANEIAAIEGFPNMFGVN